MNVFRRFFEAIVEQCQQARLVWGKELYFDGSKVQANVFTDSIKPRFVVEAHLAHLFTIETAELTEEVEQGLTHEEPTPNEPTEQEERAAPRPLPISISKELSQQKEVRHDWTLQLGAQDRSVSRKWYQRVADLRLSTTDPDARLLLTKDRAHLGSHTH